MNGERRLLLDVSPGERRAVVLLDGRPEHLLVERDGEPPFADLGSRHIGRARAVGGGRAFVDLAVGPPGLLLSPPRDLPEGAAVEVEVAAEARADKGPRLRLLGIGQGPARNLAGPPPLEARLQAYAPDALLDRSAAAREAADLAEEAVLASRHTFKGGLALTIEPSRALVAVDVDLGEGASSAARLQDANLRAVRQTARLLRLKALGGACVIDLIGFPKTAGLLTAEAERALAPDGPDVVVLAPDRLGLLRLSRPHGRRPLAERLLDVDGRLSAQTIAQRTARDLERELHAQPGARLIARCDQAVAAALTPLAALLGSRVTVEAALGIAREHPDIRAL